MNILDIKKQRLSSILVDWQVCESCRIVDRDSGRMRVGYECPICRVPGDGGVKYFEFSVHALVDLMQEAFHTESTIKEVNSDSPKNPPHSISVLLFFCTLREILLNNLIWELCRAQKIPELVYKRLLSDNRTHTQRQKNLLPSLINAKWNTALEALDKFVELDYKKLDGSIEKIVFARNKFTHEGTGWGIDRSMAEECMQNIWPILNLFVSLHNAYVHPNYFLTSKSS